MFQGISKLHSRLLVDKLVSQNRNNNKFQDSGNQDSIILNIRFRSQID